MINGILDLDMSRLAPASLPSAVARAKNALQTDDPDEIRGALEGLLLWTSDGLTPEEHQMVLSGGANPDEYLVLSAGLALAGGAVGLDQKGRQVAVLHFQTMLPMANLRGSTILGPNGEPPNPVQGALPVASARWVVPKKIFRPGVVEGISE